MRLKLANSIATILYDNPCDAIDDLVNTRLMRANNNLLTSINSDDIDQLESKIIGISVKNIYKQIYNPRRFLNISAVMVDYQMPRMNGADFCKKLIDYPIRKIMLTGKAGNDIAVDFFNNGIINKFLIKGSNNIFSEIKNAIAQEQSKYFDEISGTMLASIKTDSNHSFFRDEYIILFEYILQHTKACEYSMLDLSGSFLFLTEDSIPTLLIIKTDQEIENYLQIAKDSGASKAILTNLENRNKIPFLLTDDDYKLSPKEWGRFLFPATKLGCNDIYYSIIQDSITNIDISKVFSYKAFLKSLI